MIICGVVCWRGPRWCELLVASLFGGGTAPEVGSLAEGAGGWRCNVGLVVIGVLDRRIFRMFRRRALPSGREAVLCSCAAACDCCCDGASLELG